LAVPQSRRSRVETGQVRVLLVVAGFALALCGCGAANAPRREVLRSANPLTANVYLRITGPPGVVKYIADRLRTGAFVKYGRGAFLPPRVRHHRREAICSITHTIERADNPSLQTWRGRKARVDVYGDESSAIFCQIFPLVLARGS
jgi:hypothetical protein